ncbi:MAG: TerC family protein [Nitrospiraceae bacterium]|nr:MAG: TerC family protein [Nitrospiraceae bacterium]
MADALALLTLLIGLELVLGVDNVLVISILVDRLPETLRKRARIVGLAMALIARIVMLFVLLALVNLTDPVVFHFSVRDLILLAGGLFLLWKAVTEIHHTVEFRNETAPVSQNTSMSFISVVSQLVLLDIVFSIDSIITAIGLTNTVWIIISAVLISFLVILAFVGPIGDFLVQRPALKILALSFLITIGITIFIEGLHQHVPKAYIYLPMGFALFVELLQMRYEHNRKKQLLVRSKE